MTPDKAKPFIGRYANADLGPLTVGYEGGKLMARATSVWSEIAPRRNKDGTISLVMIAPGATGMDLLVTTKDGRRALVLNDAQHEYVFADTAPAAQ